jgi:hypothetical protein
MRERYPDLEMGFQGSAVTGRSADTGAPFDQNRQSDFDVAIAGDSVYAAARERGVPFRGDQVSTGHSSTTSTVWPSRHSAAKRPGLPTPWASRGKNARATIAAIIGRHPARFPDGGRLLLQANDLQDDSGGYLQLPDFPEYRFLLFVDEAARPDAVRARLAGLSQWRFLRRRELD